MSLSLPDDVKTLSWAAEQLGIGVSTAYRLVSSGHIPGAFKVGGQWRISVPRFLSEVHGMPVEAQDEHQVHQGLEDPPGRCRECWPAHGPDARGHGHRPAG
jgi:excisionase family DNA binding protein